MKFFKFGTPIVYIIILLALGQSSIASEHKNVTLSKHQDTSKTAVDIEWNSDQTRLGILWNYNQVVVYDTNLNMLGEIVTSDTTIDEIEWLATDEQLAIVAYTNGYEVQIWDTSELALIKSYEVNTLYEYVHIASSKTNNELAIASGKTIEIVDVESDNWIHSLSTKDNQNNFIPFVSLIWNPTMPLIASNGSFGETLIWDINQGTIKARLMVLGRMHWNDKGTKLAIVNDDGYLYIHDIFSNITTQLDEIFLPQLTHLDWRGHTLVASIYSTELSTTVINIINTFSGTVVEHKETNLQQLITSKYGIELIYIDDKGIFQNSMIPTEIPKQFLSEQINICITDADTQSLLQLSVDASNWSDITIQSENTRGDAMSDECVDELIEIANLLLEAETE